MLEGGGGTTGCTAGGAFTLAEATGFGAAARNAGSGSGGGSGALRPWAGRTVAATADQSLISSGRSGRFTASSKD